MFTKKILAAAITSQPSASGVADAIDFDGATDYLLRSSDLVGNADGKTFTFSAWVYHNPMLIGDAIALHSNFVIQTNTGGTILLQARDSASGVILQATIPTASLVANTYYSLIISIDLSNAGNRSVYINDVLQSATWTTYSNSSIGFINGNHNIGSVEGGSNKWQGRLAHVFLAYEYIDLSIESNRRIFITADRKPA